MQEKQMNIFDFIENPDIKDHWICIDTHDVCYHDETCKDRKAMCCKYCKDYKCKARCKAARKANK